jgi:hypothetical protein
MTSSVLDELDQLRSMLSNPRPGSATKQRTRSPDYTLRAEPYRTYGQALNTTQVGACQWARMALDARQQAKSCCSPALLPARSKVPTAWAGP